jgi:hypothetical protein
MRRVSQLLMMVVMMVPVLLDVGVTVTGKMGRIALNAVGLSCAVAMACAGGLLVVVVVVMSLAVQLVQSFS